jgi:hypothetical protein
LEESRGFATGTARDSWAGRTERSLPAVRQYCPVLLDLTDMTAPVWPLSVATGSAPGNGSAIAPEDGCDAGRRSVGVLFEL